MMTAAFGERGRPCRRRVPGAAVPWLPHRSRSSPETSGPPWASSGWRRTGESAAAYSASAGPPPWAAAGGPATWGCAWNRGWGWRPTPGRPSGSISRRWRWAVCPLCAIWACAMRRESAPFQTPGRRRRATNRRRTTAPPGLSGCWPTAMSRGSGWKRAWRPASGGCAWPLSRGTRPVRPSWASTMSSGWARSRTPSWR